MEEYDKSLQHKATARQQLRRGIAVAKVAVAGAALTTGGGSSLTKVVTAMGQRRESASNSSSAQVSNIHEEEEKEARSLSVLAHIAEEGDDYLSVLADLKPAPPKGSKRRMSKRGSVMRRRKSSVRGGGSKKPAKKASVVVGGGGKLSTVATAAAAKKRKSTVGPLPRKMTASTRRTSIAPSRRKSSVAKGSPRRQTHKLRDSIFDNSLASQQGAEINTMTIDQFVAFLRQANMIGPDVSVREARNIFVSR